MSEYITRQCPITMGKPTKLSRPTFTRMCNGENRKKNNLRCATCKGRKPPPELEFIDLQEAIRSMKTIKKDTTTVKRYQAECWLCGETKNVLTVKGEPTCSSCEHVWRAAGNNPDLVIKALKKAKGPNYLPDMFGVTESPNPGLEEEIANLKVRLGIADEAIESAREWLDANSDETVVDAAARRMGERRQFLFNYDDLRQALEIDFMARENVIEQAKKIMAELKEVRRKTEGGVSDQRVVPLQWSAGVAREKALLDLALDVIDGKVSGLTAEHISALR